MATSAAFELAEVDDGVVRVPCDHCDGTGRKPLPRRMGQALEFLGAATAPVSTHEVARHLGVSRENAVMVLGKLRALGLVQRKATGARVPFVWRKARP